MSDIKISELPEVGSLISTDITPFVASGTTSKIRLSNLANTMPNVPSATSSSYSLTSSYSNYAVTSSVASRILGGVTNYVPIWYTDNTLDSSQLYQLSNNIIIGGITNPDNYKLYVIGSAKFTSGVNITGSVKINNLSEVSQTNIVNYNTTTGQLYYQNTGSFTASYSISSSYAKTASYAITSSNILGGTDRYIPLWSGSDKLTISNIYQSASSIGIGTTGPQVGFLLDVNGQTIIRSLLYTQTGITSFGGGGGFYLNDNGTSKINGGPLLINATTQYNPGNIAESKLLVNGKILTTEGIQIVGNDEKTVVVSASRTDGSQYGTLMYNGWGDFSFNKSLLIGYTPQSTTAYGTGYLYVSNSVGINKTGSNAPLDVNGNAIITGSLSVTNLSNISQPNFVAYNTSTGQFTYASTSSFTAATASFVTASNVWGPFGRNSIISASYSVSSSNASSASYAFTSSFSDNFKATNLSLGTNPISVTTGYGNYISNVTYPITTSSDGSTFWIRVINNGNNLQRIKLFLDGGSDNTLAYDEFEIAISGYNMPHNILRKPTTIYNESKIVGILTSNPTGAQVEVWINVLGTAVSNGYFNIYSNVSLDILANMQASKTTTKPTKANGGAELIINNDKRTNYTIQTSNGAEFNGPVAVSGSLNAVNGVTGSLLGTASYATTASNVLGGTANFVTKWNSNTSLGSSLIYDNGSNIGIGTTSPDSLLSLEKANINNVSLFKIKAHNGPTPSTAFDIIYLNDAGVATISYYGGNQSKIVLDGGNDNAGGNISLYSGSGDLTTKIHGTSHSWLASGSGNVGIGTNAPAYKLDISGSLRSNNQVLFPGVFNISKSNIIGFDPNNGQLYYQTTSSLLPNTASYSITSSLALNNIITASADSSYLYFTKGDGSTFNVSFPTAGTATNADTASFVTASNVWGPFGRNSVISASYSVSASYAQTASYVTTAKTASYVLNAVSASYSISASNAQTSSYLTGSNIYGPFGNNSVISSSYASSSLSASYALTASYILGVVGSTPTLQQVTNQGSSTTVSSNFNGGLIVSSSLKVTGSLFLSASINVYSSSLTNTTGETNILAYNTASGKISYQSIASLGVYFGTYLPTTNTLTNISSLTMKNANYMGVFGGVYTVSGIFYMTPTSQNTETSFKMSTPTDNIMGSFINEESAAGTAYFHSGSVQSGLRLYAYIDSNYVKISYYNTTTQTAVTCSFIFTYNYYTP
jgi:hypothetical protein